MRQVFLNARVYTKQKINFTWPNSIFLFGDCKFLRYLCVNVYHRKRSPTRIAIPLTPT